MRQVKDFRLFNKILRKYYKRHCVKRVDYFNGRRFVSYWEKDDWLGYRIERPEELTPKVEKTIRQLISDEIYDAVSVAEFLKYKPNVWDSEIDDEMLYCKGFMITNRDAYAILAQAYGKYEYLYPIYKLLKCSTSAKI